MVVTQKLIIDRVAGGLLGLAAGDALGATCEFASAATIAERYGRHRDITGGGVLGWRAGQGTDDTDLALSLARTYAAGYSLARAADGFADWYAAGPRDVGGTTARALTHYRAHRDPVASGRAALGRTSAGNGSLMRALATGLVRSTTRRRRAETAAISAITHADRRCVDSCVAYVDIVSALVEGATPTQATAAVATRRLHVDVGHVLDAATTLTLADLRPTGYVLDSLTIGVWALHQPRSAEEVLIDIVNLGGDADTTAAIAGGLVGTHQGRHAIPDRWVSRLEYATELIALAPRLAALRSATR